MILLQRLDPSAVKNDQVAGVRKEIATGYRNIAVSVTSGSMAKTLRKVENEASVNVYVLIVHAMGITGEEAGLALRYADVTTGCASKFSQVRGSAEGFFKIGNSVTSSG